MPLKFGRSAWLHVQAVYDTERSIPRPQPTFVNFELCKPRDPHLSSKVTYYPVGKIADGGSSFGKQPTTAHEVLVVLVMATVHLMPHRRLHLYPNSQVTPTSLPTGPK
eukprot:1193886-Prorocentrum_minimum.AAC.5